MRAELAPAVRPPTGHHARPRLLYVVNDAGFLTSHRLCLALGAQRAGFDVHVAAAPSPALDALRDVGLRVHPTPWSGTTR